MMPMIKGYMHMLKPVYTAKKHLIWGCTIYAHLSEKRQTTLAKRLQGKLEETMTKMPMRYRRMILCKMFNHFKK